MTSRSLPGTTIRGEPSPRAEARRRYQAAACDAVHDAPAATSLAQPTPSLTERVRALYEDGVVPVREIAQLAGVTERTLYKYAAKGDWRRRYGSLEPGLARGAGGRFVPVADAGEPHPSGLKALDPAGAVEAIGRCVLAGEIAATAARDAAHAADARAAARQHRRARDARRRAADACVRDHAALAASLVVLMQWSAARAGMPVTRADVLAARIAGTVLGRMSRLVCADRR
jgi:hypothetical protein